MLSIVKLGVCTFLIGLLSATAFGQTATAAAEQATPEQARREARQLTADLQDPNYDFSKAPDQMRRVFQDMRAAASSMDQEQGREFRSDLMQQLRPLLQQNRDKIRQAMQMAFLKNLQKPLGCSDDEFAAILPYLENVVTASRAVRIGQGRGTGGGGLVANGTPANGQVSLVQQAANDLRATLEDTNASADLIKTKLDVLRQAYDKANEDLTVARKQLKGLLTQRQEAVLVEDGLLAD